jgi:hypothetical protein
VSEQALAVGRWGTATVTGSYVSPPTTSNLQQQLIDLDTKHDKAHDRLRRDFDDLSIAVANMQTVSTALRQDFQNFRTNPVNVNTISFTANQLVAIVVAAIALSGGFYILTERQAETNAAMERTQKTVEMIRVQVETLRATVLTQGRDK